MVLMVQLQLPFNYRLTTTYFILIKLRSYEIMLMIQLQLPFEKSILNEKIIKILIKILMNTDEYEYLHLVSDVLENGEWKIGRNGKTKEVFGRMMRFSLKDGTLPLLTTKLVSWKTVLKELLWFIKGQTDNRILNEQGVTIWNGNSTREFLDGRGLTDYPEGILGNIYGFQWRNFNGNYEICKCTDLSTCKCNSLENKDRVDQLQYIIDQLKDPAGRNSRRLIMTAWNPAQIDKMALPPCHMMCQFNVTDDGKLSCLLTQRSGDIGLGVPYNIASYAFLTHLIAHHTGLVANELIVSLGNAHIYEDHVEPLETQLKLIPHKFPKLKILEVRDKIEDYVLEDYQVVDYVHHPSIKMKFIA